MPYTKKPLVNKPVFVLALIAVISGALIWAILAAQHPPENAKSPLNNNHPVANRDRAMPTFSSSPRQDARKAKKEVSQGQAPLKQAFDQEKFYARLSWKDKSAYLMHCLTYAKQDKPGDEFKPVLSNKVLGEELATTLQQKKMIARIKAECQKMAGMEQRLDEDFKAQLKTAKKQRQRLGEYIRKLLDRQPEAARALFWQSLTSPDPLIRTAGFDLFYRAENGGKTQIQHRLNQLMTPLNQRLGLDFFHPQQEKGWRLLHEATQLSACQRENRCGGDSLEGMSRCLWAPELCGLSTYDIAAMTHSPADMEYIDAYMQFLLSQPPPPEDWLADVPSETGESHQSNGSGAPEGAGG